MRSGGRIQPTPQPTGEEQLGAPEKILPGNRFELLAYVVDLIRELLKDTAMSVRLSGLILVSVLAVERATVVMELLTKWHELAAAGIAAMSFIVSAAAWSIRRIRRGAKSRRST